MPSGEVQDEVAVEEPAASFTDLTAGLVQDILRHLDLKGQGRAACVSKLCAAAVLPLAPALAHYVTAGDAPAVRWLLQKPDGRLGLDKPSCTAGLPCRWQWPRTVLRYVQPCSKLAPRLRVVISMALLPSSWRQRWAALQ